MKMDGLALYASVIQVKLKATRLLNEFVRYFESGVNQL